MQSSPPLNQHLLILSSIPDCYHFLSQKPLFLIRPTAFLHRSHTHSPVHDRCRRVVIYSQSRRQEEHFLRTRGKRERGALEMSSICSPWKRYEERERRQERAKVLPLIFLFPAHSLSSTLAACDVSFISSRIGRSMQPSGPVTEEKMCVRVARVWGNWISFSNTHIKINTQNVDSNNWLLGKMGLSKQSKTIL